MEFSFAISLLGERTKLRFGRLEGLNDGGPHVRMRAPFLHVVGLSANHEMAARGLHFDVDLVDIPGVMMFGTRLDGNSAEHQPAVEFFELSDTLKNIGSDGLRGPHIVEARSV